MPDFRSIYDAYRQAETPLSLKEFSRLGNYLSGDDSFAPADLNGFQETVKKGSYWFDKALEATGAPQASADLFGSVFKSLGGSEEAGREVGASLPRTAVEWAPAIAGGPVGIGSRLGLAIAGAAGAAGAYEKTDSGASAATAGAMPFVGSALGSTAASALAKAAGWTPEMLAGSASKRIVQYIASQAGALGGMEAINAVESGQAPDYTSKDYWLKLAASQLPFAVFDAKRVLAKPELPVPPVEPPKAPGEPTPTEVPISPESAKVEIAAPTIDSPEAKLEAKEKISISRKEALAEAEAIDNPVDKQKAIEGINKSHDELVQAIDLGTKPKEEVTKVEEEKKSKANYTSWDSEAAANRFAESIKGKYDVNVIPDEATGKFNVEYSKKAEVEKLPTMPEVDPNAAPEQAVKVLTEVDKKEEVNKQIVELVAKGETPARAVEIATNKVLGEATEVPVETPAKAKNKGGRPSTTEEVEALFTRLMSDTPGTPRDAEFAKAMKDHKVAEVVQDNSKAQTNSQANKGYRVLRNAYDAWTNGVDWGGIKMDGKPASEVMSAIKSRIKAEMKRPITAGSKPYVEHVTGEDPVGEAKEALAEESKVALETEDEEEALETEDEEEALETEDNSPDDLQEGDKDNLARSKGDSLDPDQVAAEQSDAIGSALSKGDSLEAEGLLDDQSDAIGSALSFGHRLEAEGLLDDQATRIAWANHVFAMKAKAKTPEAKKLVETRLEALAKWLKVERKDIGPALRDYWFKQNEEWEARGNSGAILRPAGGGFEYALDEYDPVKNRLGKHTLPKDGWITEGQLKVMGQKQRLMKDHEIELYKVIVPEAFKDGKVNVPVLDKGLQKNIAVEVHTYGQEGKVSEARKELDQLTHDWFDNLPISAQNTIRFRSNMTKLDREVLQQEGVDLAKVDKWLALDQTVGQEPRYEGPRATDYYTSISPFDTKQFPVVRVDVVLPEKHIPFEEYWKQLGFDSPTSYQGKQLTAEQQASLRKDYETKYGFDKKSTLWSPDNLHENLPNTLGWAMVQVVPRKIRTSNPDAPVAIVGIGKGYEHQLDWFLQSNAVPQWVKDKIKSGAIKYYDMRTLPENGDVIDNLNQHSAVLGAHLFGVDLKMAQSLKPDYFYSRQNSYLVPLAEKKGIPVYLFGDQPTGQQSRGQVIAYEPKPEKVMFVGELQSRWGQETFARESALKKGEVYPTKRFDRNGPTEVTLSADHGEDHYEFHQAQLTKAGWDGKVDVVGWAKANAKKLAEVSTSADQAAILPLHQELILKAVIKEAQKQGISKVAISDGETAMMTEGHDKSLRELSRMTGFGDWVTVERRQEDLQKVSDQHKIPLNQLEAVFEKGARIIREKNPSQAGGMRLAYDTTLPSIMKQLTGERGEMWDGGVHKNAELQRTNVQLSDGRYGMIEAPGSPVFKNLDGTPKTNATGRIYDITNAKELARFNRGGRSPLAGLETKLEGVAATFDSLFYRVARKSGLHDKETAAILPSFKKMLEVAGMKDVEYGELISDSLVGGKDIKGMATTMGEKTRRMWLAALGGKDKVDWSRSMMALIAHENGHLVDQLYNTNQLMGARAKQAYEKMLKWKDTASPEELKATLKQAAEMLLPEKWQQLPELKEMLDVADGTEALATLHGIFSLSEGVKRFDAEIGSALLPAGPRGFLRTLAEYGSSFVKLLKNMLHIGGKPDKVKLFESLQENYKELQHGVKQASENLYNLQKLMSYNPADMSQVKLSTLEALQTAENPDSVKQMARFLAVEPKDKEDSQLLNAPVGMIHQAARGMSYLLEPLDSLTARFPVFADVGSAIMQTPATAKRLLGDFLSPMYGERDKITGDITAGSKEQQKMQKLWHEDVAVNEAINKIEFWQQKSREIWDPAIGTQRGPVAELLRNMTPEKRNAVLAKVAKTRIAVGVQHQAILDAFKEKNKYELAERLAARKPQLHEKSLEIADLVSTWADYSAKGETALAAQMQMEAAKLMPDPIALAKLQEHAKAMQTQRDALKQFYVDRPWFHSYSRIGEWAVDAWDKNNKQVKHAVPAKSNAEAIALEKQFRSEGLKTNIKKISRGRFVKFDEEFQSMLQNIDDTLRRSAQDYFNGELPPDKVDEFFSENSFSGTLKHFAEVQSKFKPTEDGRTLRGAEDLDVMRMELEQAGLLANSLAKTISGSKLAWAKRNPKLTTPDMAHVMKQYESAWGNYHVPDNVTVSKITKGISVYSLALNMANHMAELVQPGTTILSQATAEHGAMNSVKTLMGVLKDVAGYYTKRLGNKLSLSDEFVEWGHSGEKNMLNTLADEGMLHNGSFTDGLDPRDQGLVSLKMRARGAGQGYVGSAVQNVADSTMRLYASFNRHNARIAGLLGYRLGVASGMDHIQATDYAKRFVERAALTNTRALRPVGLFGEDTRALGQLATVMQRYNMGWLSMAARHIQRGWLLSDAQAASRGFDAESKGKARNAALMLLGSQLLAAGAVGLPFAGAMTKAYEALTGDDIKADTYQMFDKMMGEDSQSSGFFADSLIRGFANSTLSAAGIPVDMSSRFAIGGLPGMSEVSGFDAGSAFGPVGGMIKTIATGAEVLAKDRDIVRAGKVLMPTGLRRLFDLAMNGDMTDNNMNRMGLSGSEKMLYGLGFTPDRIRKLRDFENMQENVTSGRRLQTDRIESQIASLMQTDPAAAQQMLHDKAKSLEISSKDLASGVAKQVEKKTLAKDFRSAIPSLDAKASMSLMRGLGTDFGEPSETKKAQLRANVRSSLGVAPDIRDMIRARRADEMLSQISRQPLAMTRQKRPSFLW